MEGNEALRSARNPSREPMREALERIKSISQRADMPAQSKVACIESIAHSALAPPTAQSGDRT